jgi:predicted ABC-type transport system involved in lysophospholipase L1 biosynthesis ATPase subunit
MMPARVSRTPLHVAEKRAKEILADVGLADRIDHRPGELSGGQQQRVALARALVNEPRVLLADEPTGNLDEETGAEIHAMIEKLNRERGITAIIVTHNPRLADRMRRRLHLDASGLTDSGLVQGSVASPAPSTSAAVPSTHAG